MVSAPNEWGDLDAALRPDHWTVRTAPERQATAGGPLRPLPELTQELPGLTQDLPGLI